MPGRTLRRFFVSGLVLGLCMLPLASAQASPRNGGHAAGQKAMIHQIQDFGRSLLQFVEEALGLSGPGQASATNPLNPFGSDGRGIDPNGVPR